MHAQDGDSAERAAQTLRASYVLGDAAPEAYTPVIEVQRAV